MKHIWSILCEKSSIDFESNSLSLFNCIEELKLVIDKTKQSKNDKLVAPVSFQMVNFWTTDDDKDENSLKIRGELIDPKGTVLNKFESDFEIKKGIKRFRSRINIKGIPITENGRYYFKTWQKKNDKFELVSELPLDIDVSYKLLDGKSLKK